MKKINILYCLFTSFIILFSTNVVILSKDRYINVLKEIQARPDIVTDAEIQNYLNLKGYKIDILEEPTTLQKIIVYLTY